ncbi:hypothetical protein NPIL_392711 [Nephila pilipes]|uniref:Uncharacterized protein n=1 Tax=Nephila pilipes TaxID=299642 RepID=A0A8X6QJ21_NEPPI|nr:hypothetical protein NPIL_392711 [Nephila pilipes]
MLTDSSTIAQFSVYRYDKATSNGSRNNYARMPAPHSLRTASRIFGNVRQFDEPRCSFCSSGRFQATISVIYSIAVTDFGHLSNLYWREICRNSWLVTWGRSAHWCFSEDGDELTPLSTFADLCVFNHDIEVETGISMVARPMRAITVISEVLFVFNCSGVNLVE